MDLLCFQFPIANCRVFYLSDGWVMHLSIHALVSIYFHLFLSRCCTSARVGESLGLWVVRVLGLEFVGLQQSHNEWVSQRIFTYTIGAFFRAAGFKLRKQNVYLKKRKLLMPPCEVIVWKTLLFIARRLFNSYLWLSSYHPEGHLLLALIVLKWMGNSEVNRKISLNVQFVSSCVPWWRLWKWFLSFTDMTL